jgi:RND family efflux transporter MFP subunit
MSGRFGAAATGRKAPRRIPGDSRRVPGPSSLLVLAAAAALALSACDRSPGVVASVRRDAESDPIVEVRTSHVRLGSISQALSAPGSLVARRESRIGAEVTGRIEHVFVSEGDRVEAGAPLFQIDRGPYEMALRRALAGLDLASAERDQLRSDLGRSRELARQRVISEQEIERLTTSLAVAEARVRQSEEAVALARHDLERTLARAPYEASVAARLADEGTTALVQPQTIVVVLQETSRLEARAAIPESQLSLVAVGDRALVHVEGLSDPIETRVSVVSDVIDAATRTYLVKMDVPNPDHRLKAGVFAHIEILPEPKTGTIVVPRGAVRSEDGRTRLMVVRGDRVEAVPVELGLVSEEAAEVLSGVGVGDEIVVGDAARTIAPGMRVRAAPPAGDESS